MLVGVLISIMISIVVGVNLIPSIVTSINTAKATPNAPSGMSGLLDVLVYVYIAVILLGAVAWINHRIVPFHSNVDLQTPLSRGSRRQGNPELAVGWMAYGQA